jgi:hypothetical protein
VKEKSQLRHTHPVRNSPVPAMAARNASRDSPRTRRLRAWHVQDSPDHGHGLRGLEGNADGAQGKPTNATEGRGPPYSWASARVTHRTTRQPLIEPASLRRPVFAGSTAPLAPAPREEILLPVVSTLVQRVLRLDLALGPDAMGPSVLSPGIDAEGRGSPGRRHAAKPRPAAL